MNTRKRMGAAAAWALAASTALAQNAEPSPAAGPYVLLAAGRTDYLFRCVFSCNQELKGNSGRIGLGYSAGAYGGEVVWTDHGRARSSDGSESQHTQALGLNLVLTARPSNSLDFSFRVGAVYTRDSSTNDRKNTSSNGWGASYGLASGLALGKQSVVQLAVDIAASQSASSNATLLWSLGLRQRF
jgi:hypothetical protein